MRDKEQLHLSRRERQIMDVIYSRGQATGMDVLENLPDPPSYSAVRALLAILEKKGHIKHKRAGLHYVYLPIRSRQQAARSAMQRVVTTFFEGSAEKAMLTLQEIRAPRARGSTARMAR
jgi:BlaI family transcriptional regulator, penicillinase repressor